MSAAAMSEPGCSAQGRAPLAGVRIADFTIHAAGPFCTHLLSQLGAECIKVESSTRLDAFRKPHAVYGRMQAATFDQVSANKLSVRLNLKQPEAVALAKRLVAVCDVAAESFRPGVMNRLGLGFEALRAVKPDVVLLSLSSSGQSGPDSHFTGYAPLFGAWGGLGWMSGYPDGPPVEMRHVMDHASGMHAAMALVAAMHQRRRTGRAQHVDLAAREVASAMLGLALLCFFTVIGTLDLLTGWGDIGREDKPRLDRYGVIFCAAWYVGTIGLFIAIILLIARSDLSGAELAVRLLSS